MLVAECLIEMFEKLGYLGKRQKNLNAIAMHPMAPQKMSVITRCMTSVLPTVMRACAEDDQAIGCFHGA